MKLHRVLILFFIPWVSAAQEYHWPTDAGKLLSSTFAESRDNRFHAGIDVKTQGQVGFKVFAVRSGYISRIQVSPFGYGRVLYQTLDTGEIAVYGHLLKFIPTIQNAVERKQEARNRYSVTLLPNKEQFPVNQGDLIAYTGESGVGYPHLHFELRDASSRPINPHAKGMAVQDHMAPVIQTVSLVPLSASARVAGDLRPLLIKPRRINATRYQIDEPVRVTGLIAFGLEAFDQMEGSPNKFGAYGNRLFIDDRELFASQYDRFSYEDNGQASLDRDYRLLSRDKGYFYKLFRDHGNELKLYSTSKLYGGVVAFDLPAPATGWLYSILQSLGLDWQYPDGVTTLPNGHHEFRIETRDFWGNAAAVSGRLIAGEPFVPAKSTTPRSDSLRVKMEVEFYDDYCRLEFLFSQEPKGRLEIEGRTSLLSTEHISLERIGPRKYICGWPLNSGQTGPIELQLRQKTETGDHRIATERLQYHTVAKNSAKILRSEDERCLVHFHSASLYRPLFVRMQTQPEALAPVQARISAIYAVNPDDVAMANAVTVRFRLTESDSGNDVGIYRQSGKPVRWQFIGNDRQEQAGFISASTTALGCFCLIRDSIPPVLLSLQPVDGLHLSDRTPLLRASFKDELSGMGSEENLQLWLDGKKTIAEYDPEEQSLRFQVRRPLSAGRHILECRLSDRSHNQVSKKNIFWVK